MRKKDINEIIDGDDNLIGSMTQPAGGANKETEASKTTDYNASVHGQNFKNDFLGRFGFWFYESKEDDGIIKEKLAKLFYGKFLQSLDYYHENPELLEKDYNTHLVSNGINFDNMDSIDHSWADEAMKIISPITKDKIDENQELQEELVEPKDKNLKKEKDDDNELSTKEKKVADLIDKLSDSEKEKIKGILEKK